jgi:hypothetical protein
VTSAEQTFYPYPFVGAGRPRYPAFGSTTVHLWFEHEPSEGAKAEIGAALLPIFDVREWFADHLAATITGTPQAAIEANYGSIDDGDGFEDPNDQTTRARMDAFSADVATCLASIHDLVPIALAIRDEPSTDLDHWHRWSVLVATLRIERFRPTLVGLRPDAEQALRCLLRLAEFENVTVPTDYTEWSRLEDKIEPLLFRCRLDAIDRLIDRFSMRVVGNAIGAYYGHSYRPAILALSDRLIGFSGWSDQLVNNVASVAIHTLHRNDTDPAARKSARILLRKVRQEIWDRPELGNHVGAVGLAQLGRGRFALANEYFKLALTAGPSDPRIAELAFEQCQTRETVLQSA